MGQHSLFKDKASAKCSPCGAKIKWVRTIRGKWMICEPGGIVTEGGETIITPGGHMKKKCEPGHFGYIPHWSTCPFAKKYRKNK